MVGGSGYVNPGCLSTLYLKTSLRQPYKKTNLVYVWLIHFAVQQKLTQHCKAIILQ